LGREGRIKVKWISVWGLNLLVKLRKYKETNAIGVLDS